MSKKNLGRSAIEGGRSGYSKHERRESSQHERVKVRAMIAASHGDPEAFEDVVIPRRRWAFKDFQDKLNPVRKWMDDRVGKSWNKTYSLMKQKFDSRTVAGRHIVYDHMLRDVWMSPDYSNQYAKYHRYYVDAHGVLRKMPSRRKDNEKVAEKLRAEKVRAEQWLDKRLIGKIGNVLYWYNPTVHNYRTKFDWWSGGYSSPGYSSPLFIYPLETRFIRGDRLTGREIEFFTKLDPNHKKTLLKYSEILGSCNCIHAVHHHIGGECRVGSCKCGVKWIS